MTDAQTHPAATARRQDRADARVRWLLVLLWLPLFLLPGQELSWEAHDEGLYVGRARLMLETGNWIHPFAKPHHKPPGFYWLLAAVFSAAGANEWISRLPSALATLASMLLLHGIGRSLGLRRGAVLAPLAFATMPLVVVAGHLARPDPLFVAMGLLLTLCALRATAAAPGAPARGPAGWAAGAGLLLGLMALLRGPAPLWFAVGLLPFLAWRWREGRRVPVLPFLAGLAIGALPLLLWLVLAWRQEPRILASLLGFTTSLVLDTREDNGPLYYLWNVAANGFPWAPLGIAGAALLLRGALPEIGRGERLLLWSTPLLLLATMSMASTRLPHYALGAYPFLALLAGAFLESVERGWRDRRLLGALALLGGLIAAAAVAFARGSPGPAAAAGVSGLALLGAALLALRRRDLGWPQAVVAALWTGGVAAALTSTLGNPNPATKAFLREGPVAEALSEPVPMLGDLGKAGVLIRAYGPMPVEILDDAAALPAGALLWADPGAPPDRPHEEIARSDGAALLRLR